MRKAYIEEVGAVREEKDWDTSEIDAKNIIRSEYPDYVIRTRKCLIQMSKNRVESTNLKTIKRYAKRYGINQDKLIAMY